MITVSSFFKCGARPKVVCATYETGRVCGGDSGGPVVADKDNDGRFVLYGIVSFGTVPCNEGFGSYDGYSDVSNWYETIIATAQANP